MVGAVMRPLLWVPDETHQLSSTILYQSVVAVIHAGTSCCWPFREAIWCAVDSAFERAGRSISTRIAMIAITTRSSISVNPVGFVGYLENLRRTFVSQPISRR